MEYIGHKKDRNDRRFVLEVRNSTGKNLLYVFGLNPSDAQGKVAENINWVRNYVQGIKKITVTKDKNNEYAIDKTIERVEFFTQKAEYDGFVMFNVCAQRTTEPKYLKRNGDLHNDNMKVINEYLDLNTKGKEKIAVLLAFGNAIDNKSWLLKYFEEISNILKNYNPVYYVLKDNKKASVLTSPSKNKNLSNGRNPRHPSRLSNGTVLEAVDFNKDEYCKWKFL